jgi:2-polyprenyl-6-methoxyphenol hydroxylase-like FAD-dependent oxidoreductase
MRIVVNGGGPSGLYFALLARKQLDAEVAVYEQNPRHATYGFGIVLADRGLNRLKAADPRSYEMIMDSCYVSRHRVVYHKDEKIFIEGGGYGAAIARLRLLEILQQCCEDAGVEVHYDCRRDGKALPNGDLIVGADGVNSAVRNDFADDFGMRCYQLTNKLAWYGTKALFPYPILSFRKTDLGHFWAVGYAYTEQMSTFVAECDVGTWERSLAHLSDEERTRVAEEVFAEELGGQALISNKSLWHSLPVTRVTNWAAGNKVLIGDALHSAHPSIGSGTRIAMEDSIALVQALAGHKGDIAAGLASFRRSREPIKQKLVEAAEKSFCWYEEIVPRLDAMEPAALVFDYLTRTGRVGEERLVEEFPAFMRRYESAWRRFASA